MNKLNKYRYIMVSVFLFIGFIIHFYLSIWVYADNSVMKRDRILTQFDFHLQLDPISPQNLANLFHIDLPDSQNDEQETLDEKADAIIFLSDIFVKISTIIEVEGQSTVFVEYNQNGESIQKRIKPGDLLLGYKFLYNENNILVFELNGNEHRVKMFKPNPKKESH